MNIEWLHDLLMPLPSLEHKRVCNFRVQHRSPRTGSCLAPPGTALKSTTTLHHTSVFFAHASRSHTQLTIFTGITHL